MKLYLQGHDCRYAVEQLQLALFGQPLELSLIHISEPTRH